MRDISLCPVWGIVRTRVFLSHIRGISDWTPPADLSRFARDILSPIVDTEIRSLTFLPRNDSEMVSRLLRDTSNRLHFHPVGILLACQRNASPLPDSSRESNHDTVSLDRIDYSSHIRVYRLESGPLWLFGNTVLSFLSDAGRLRRLINRFQLVCIFFFPCFYLWRV